MTATYSWEPRSSTRSSSAVRAWITAWGSSERATTPGASAHTSRTPRPPTTPTNTPLSAAAGGTGPGRGGLPVGTDRDALPLVRVNPDYPPGPLSRGTEGWVRVQFSVTVVGTVRDAVVVASEPRSIFDEAALKAIARWRYNPRVVNGEAVERVGLETIIRFDIEN